MGHTATPEAESGGLTATEHHLANGLRVVLSEDHLTPVAAVCLWYDVGSRHEVKGRTGLAHLFEHLMFEGSENVGKGEHFKLVAEAGGSMNGTTSEDRTNYFETLPAECLDLGLYLEADRMRALVLTQEKLDNQREAVKEEKRLRVDNQPYATSYETTDFLAYDAFAYKHPVIGSMSDLDASSLDDAREFYARYYAPGNGLLCLTGDVEVADAFARVERFFGAIPARKTPAPFHVDEPEPTGERRAHVVDAHAAVPGIHVNVKIPPRRHPDLLALSYAEKILGGGESGRLWRRLVKDDELALSLSLGIDERRGPSLFRVFALSRPGVTLETLETEIRKDLERFAAEGPTDREMARAKRQVFSDVIRLTQTTQSIAFLLSEYGVYDGAPGLWREDVAKQLSLTAADVRDAAARLFVPARTSVVTVVPADGSPS